MTTTPKLFSFDTDDYQTYARAHPTDPRVVAVVQRDNDAHAPDGGAYAPAFSVYRGRFTAHGSTYVDSDVTASVIERAMAHYGNDTDMTERYLSMIYGVREVRVVSDHRDSEVWIVDTPSWRKHVGITEESVPARFVVGSITAPGEYLATEHETDSQAQARAAHVALHPDRKVTHVDRVSVLDGDAETWQAYIDGDVYGVGVLVNLDHVLPFDADEDVPTTDDGGWEWDDHQVWGYYGDDYAASEAVDLADNVAETLARDHPMIVTA